MVSEPLNAFKGGGETCNIFCLIFSTKLKRNECSVLPQPRLRWAASPPIPIGEQNASHLLYVF